MHPGWICKYWKFSDFHHCWNSGVKMKYTNKFSYFHYLYAKKLIDNLCAQINTANLESQHFIKSTGKNFVINQQGVFPALFSAPNGQEPKATFSANFPPSHDPVAHTTAGRSMTRIAASSANKHLFGSCAAPACFLVTRSRHPGCPVFADKSKISLCHKLPWRPGIMSSGLPGSFQKSAVLTKN